MAGVGMDTLLRYWCSTPMIPIANADQNLCSSHDRMTQTIPIYQCRTKPPAFTMGQKLPSTNLDHSTSIFCFDFMCISPLIRSFITSSIQSSSQELLSTVHQCKRKVSIPTPDILLVQKIRSRYFSTSLTSTQKVSHLKHVGTTLCFQLSSDLKQWCT